MRDVQTLHIEISLMTFLFLTILVATNRLSVLNISKINKTFNFLRISVENNNRVKRIIILSITKLILYGCVESNLL